MRRALLVPMVFVLGATLLVACGDDDDDPSQYHGSAARVASEFFLQERAGNQLPEGQSVAGQGTGQVISLDTEDGEQARVCVEYRYRAVDSPTVQRVRVYHAALLEDGWEVTPIEDESACADDA